MKPEASPYGPSYGIPPPPPTSPRVVDEECSLVRHFEDAIISLLTISKCLLNFNVMWFCVSPPDCPLDPWSACWKHWVSFNCKDFAVRTKRIKVVCGPCSKKTSLFAWYGYLCECGWFFSNLNLRFGCFSPINKFWRKFVPFMIISIFLFNRKNLSLANFPLVFLHFNLIAKKLE